MEKRLRIKAGQVALEQPGVVNDDTDHPSPASVAYILSTLRVLNSSFLFYSQESEILGKLYTLPNVPNGEI